MIRTQIYLTEKERKSLMAIARITHASQSQLIREAIDYYIKAKQENHRSEILKSAKGLWQHRDDLPDFTNLRKEFDRT